ncbi:VRR-NUC domain-containing protein [Vreelandella zhaodongensis]|uniref:phosphodiesterase I n=1 Tax=Vreelandella zhaodongensis TaxID=1176240 RepID=A0ABX2SUU1_VREZH|nr:VRR-NUC domain-containing protein [Halomonas zhaodongensis]NYS45875.1 VRR-NUC domain-containing protein [Halomonas zhaodongensis]
MNSAPVASATASLDDPFYYLTNFRYVLAWVEARHYDLLSASERDAISHFETLPQASQALLVRMVMRKGELFRLDKLTYAEIGDSEQALEPLVALGWVDNAPQLNSRELFRLLRLSELRQALVGEITNAGLARNSTKGALQTALEASLQASAPLQQWWPTATTQIVRLTVMALCDRLRLMFFGNLRQDWAEFVLTELGLQRFEQVPLTVESRAFQSRSDVTTYLTLHRLRERLDDGEPPQAFSTQVPPASSNRWLASRRARLLLAIGRAAERGGDAELALTLYADANNSDARIRRLRVLERLGRYSDAYELTVSALDAQPNEGEIQALMRLLPRLARKLSQQVERLARSDQQVAQAPTYVLHLPGPQPVERAVADYMATPNAPVYYVENGLLTGLFGLLLWPAIFKPLPGAFFHPFHSGPADLHREDFVPQRQADIDACLAQLDDGRYQDTILRTWHAKQGIASPFVHWGIVSEELLTLALRCLPPAHLRACFMRLLDDLKHNRAGLPDLIQLMPDAPPGEPRYKMIEVKGPGDRLQDNQRRWIDFFCRHGMPIEVCHVRWQPASEAQGPEPEGPGREDAE